MNHRSIASRSARLMTALTLTAATIGGFSPATSAQEASTTRTEPSSDLRWGTRLTDVTTPGMQPPSALRWGTRLTDVTTPGMRPPSGLRWGTRLADVTVRPADSVQRYETAVEEGRRVLQALEEEYAVLTKLEEREAAMAVNNRIIGLSEQLREFDRQLDLARIFVRAETSVQVSFLQDELKRLREDRSLIANERAATMIEYENAVARTQALQERAGAAAVGLGDLRADIDNRRRRALDLEIERQVATATVDFLRARIGELLDRIERGIVEDEVVNRLRASEESQRALLERSFSSPMEVTAILERRLAREDALAERLGRGLVLQLESRLVDSELKLLTIEVQRRTLERQVAEAGGQIDAAMQSARLATVELPRLESRIADLDAVGNDLERHWRLREAELDRAMEQLGQLQEESAEPGSAGTAGSE